MIITVAFSGLIRGIIFVRLKRQDENYQNLVNDFKKSDSFRKSIKIENDQLVESFNNTLALYELTKDICKSLEEEKVFDTFNKNLKKYISVGDCRYIKDNADLIKFKNYTILPLELEPNQIAGYLAVDRILEIDKEKFGILVQQFLIGLKRSLLYQKVQGLTITDALTSVYCRRYFLERFSEELKRSKKNKLSLTFLMLDIDNFKQFNDRYGHLVGDAILCQVSKIIRDAVRQIDFIGRYGGEEIAIVLAETNIQQANFAAQRICQSIAAQLFKVYDEELKVTVSIGVSTFPDNAADMQNLIELADQALYLAKKTGKNRVCFSPA